MSETQADLALCRKRTHRDARKLGLGGLNYEQHQPRNPSADLQHLLAWIGGRRNLGKLAEKLQPGWVTWLSP